MSQERIPTLRALTDVGLTVGAIITQETVKGALKLTTGAVRFAGRQTMQNLQRAVEVTDAHSYRRGQNGQKHAEEDVSRDEAMNNFLTALVQNPTDTEAVAAHFEVVATKIKGVQDVSDGIRLSRGPDGVVPMTYIAQEFLIQLATTADEFGIPPETSTVWLDTLRDHTGIEPERQILTAEQAALDRMMARTRETSSLTI